MGAAPAQITLMDIMDEQDEVDLSKPSGVGMAYHQDDGEPRVVIVDVVDGTRIRRWRSSRSRPARTTVV